jgi:hypothetical protein
MKDPEFQKLLTVSEINKVDSLEEILSTNEWISFYNNLKNNEGPDECFYICAKHKLEGRKKIKKEFDLKENKIIKIESR